MLMAIMAWTQGIIGGIAIAGYVKRLLERGRWRRYRGRHISKNLGRLVSFERLQGFETLLLFTWVGFIAANWISGATVLLFISRLFGICWNSWLCDDVWFSDDDERRWEAFKARLWKCKPVMKRAVQRWKPQTPRVPVPA